MHISTLKLLVSWLLNYKMGSERKIFFLLLEPVILIGDGEYNVNNVKELKVTESFLGLNEEVRECQDRDGILSCTTRQYLHTILEECGCLPINMKLSLEVLYESIKSKTNH